MSRPYFRKKRGISGGIFGVVGTTVLVIPLPRVNPFLFFPIRRKERTKKSGRVGAEVRNRKGICRDRSSHTNAEPWEKIDRALYCPPPPYFASLFPRNLLGGEGEEDNRTSGKEADRERTAGKAQCNLGVKEPLEKVSRNVGDKTVLLPKCIGDRSCAKRYIRSLKFGLHL